MVLLVKAGGRYNYQLEEYEVNEEQEIALIPNTAPVGSEATVIETGKKYKKLPDGTWAEFYSGGGGSGNIMMTGTMGTNEQDKTTITLDKTAAELYTAVSGGVFCKISITVTDDVTIEVITTITGVKIDSEGTGMYSFFTVGGDGKQYGVEDAIGTDTVVLTEL